MPITVVQGLVATTNELGATFDFGAITNSTINSTPVGASSPSTGNFTTVSATSLNVSGIVSAGTALFVNGNITCGSVTGLVFAPTSNSLAGTRMYLPAANTLGFSSGGIQVVTISTASINLAAQPITVSAAQLNIATSGGLEFATITSGQGAQTATLLTSPVAGNPSFWIPVRINGTIRFVPAW